MQSPAEEDGSTWNWQLDRMIEVASELEASSGWTWAHSGRVARYAVTMGKALRLSEDDMLALQCASLLHDVGKMIVPEALLNKVSKLSRDEWYAITKHPMASALIIKDQALAVQIASIARSHHEWFDGSGYPMGLKGEAIPLGARILSLADAYDAMSSDRPYRPALAPPEIMNQIDKGVGTQFDPALVNRLRPLLANGLDNELSVKRVRIITDDAKLVQQLWFALYPNGWEIDPISVTGSDDAVRLSTPAGHRATEIMTVTIIDGNCEAAVEKAKDDPDATQTVWIDPPDSEMGIQRPLDLASLLKVMRNVEGPQQTDGVIRVILADPFQLFRQALKQGLESQGDIVVVAETSTPRAYRKVRSEIAYDIAIVASDLLAGTMTTSPLHEGDMLLAEVEALAADSGEHPAIVLVSDEDFSGSELADKVWQPGLSVSTNAYIFRGSPVEVLIEAVRTLATEFTYRKNEVTQ